MNIIPGIARPEYIHIYIYRLNESLLSVLHFEPRCISSRATIETSSQNYIVIEDALELL